MKSSGGARDIVELNAMLITRLYQAMHKTADDVLNDMNGAMQDYYDSATPNQYNRTEAMKHTPKVSGVETDVTSKSASFEAYLDTNYQYTTGKNPTMLDVLRLANNGITNSSVGRLNPTVGSKGFWEKSIKNADKRLNKNLKKYLKIK